MIRGVLVAGGGGVGGGGGGDFSVEVRWVPSRRRLMVLGDLDDESVWHAADTPDVPCAREITYGDIWGLDP